MDPTEHGGDHSKISEPVGGIWRAEIHEERRNHGGTERGFGWTGDRCEQWVAKGKMPRYSTRQQYTQVLQDLRHQLMFSLGILKSETGGVFGSAVLRNWHVLCFPVLRWQDVRLCERLQRWLGVIFWGLARRTITLARPFRILTSVLFYFKGRESINDVFRFRKLSYVRRGVYPPPPVSSFKQYL
jgi:hypothetical protein